MGWVSFIVVEIRITALTLLIRYPIGMAEWTPEENMGDCEKLVVTFNEEAAEEGLEVETDSIILLKEAVDGGWTE